jgi:hypothetical protein
VILSLASYGNVHYRQYAISRFRMMVRKRGGRVGVDPLDPVATFGDGCSIAVCAPFPATDFAVT